MIKKQKEHKFKLVTYIWVNGRLQVVECFYKTYNDAKKDSEKQKKCKTKIYDEYGRLIHCKDEKERENWYC